MNSKWKLLGVTICYTVEFDMKLKNVISALSAHEKLFEDKTNENYEIMTSHGAYLTRLTPKAISRFRLCETFRVKTLLVNLFLDLKQIAQQAN